LYRYSDFIDDVKTIYMLDMQLRYYTRTDNDALTDSAWAMRITHVRKIREMEIVSDANRQLNAIL